MLTQRSHEVTLNLDATSCSTLFRVEPVGSTLSSYVPENTAAAAPCSSESSANVQDVRKTKMARHASFNITPTPVAVMRQVSSAPSSPRCHLPGRKPAIVNSNLHVVLVFTGKTDFFFYVTGSSNQSTDFSRTTVSNSSACRPQFGSSTE